MEVVAIRNPSIPFETGLPILMGFSPGLASDIPPLP
jgi:hypothetical protein